MKYFKKLKGEKIYLSPINIEDKETYVKWMNDEEVTKYIGKHHNITSLTNEEEFLKDISTKDYNFAIVSESDDELLGNISLSKLKPIHRTAELGIMIGEKHNKGYGTDAIKTILKYGFYELNLNNISLSVYEFNERAIHTYQKCGFQEFGRKHQAYFYNNQYHDIIYMEILKEDYERNNNEK